MQQHSCSQIKQASQVSFYVFGSVCVEKLHNSHRCIAKNYMTCVSQWIFISFLFSEMQNLNQVLMSLIHGAVEIPDPNVREIIYFT